MKKSDRIIQLGGIGASLIALIVYILTLEPTASFWDCGEFIACAYRLEIAHPPGAPVFLLLGRIFSLFAGQNPEKVAFWVNMLSSVASAATIFFLYHTIVWFVRKAIDNRYPYQNTLVFFSAFIGSLAFAFTDSFWFSAVEGEVYATSSLVTATVFWAVLRWESAFTGKMHPASLRWILLIFFLLGLSIGIHLLNLLAIPAIGLVIYYKTQQPSGKKLFITLLLTVLVLGIIVFVYIPGLVKIGTCVDLFTVNSLKMKPNTGFLIYFLILFSGVLFLLPVLRKRKNPLAYLVLLCFLMLTLGYSSYTSVVIRSMANPAIDMNNPDNPFSLLHYLNREQYGQRSLIKGPFFNAPVASTTERISKTEHNGRYVDEPLNPEVHYDERFLTFFPRMWSGSAEHIKAYKQWGNIEGRPVKIQNRNGNLETRIKPTFTENMRYFFRYQVGHMFLRYFMWNFAGRQNDIQGFGEITQGNWISGIPFLDALRLGPQQELPDKFHQNKGRNTYYFLPLILGFLGIWYQRRYHKQGFWINITFFLLTGLAIVVYLNEIPITPRERDYVYVGSFYAFAIWIGLSVPALFHLIKRYFRVRYALISVGMIVFFSGPVLLITQNYDDHDRSGRYIARDMGHNYLQSCRPDAILFTSADNDTYPLWYIQEVEGVRTDVRQVLYPYLSANWYIEQQQMDRPDSKSIPMSFLMNDFLNGKRDYVPVVDRIKQPIPLGQLLNFVQSDNEKTRLRQGSGLIDYIPATEYLIKTPFTGEDDSAQYIQASLKKRYLLKTDLVLLDVINKNNWERPVYFFNPQVAQELGLGDYLVREGLGYRLIPYKVTDDDYDVAYNYTLFTQTFQWGNIQNTGVYTDWTCRRNIGLVVRLREQYSYLANQLIALNDMKKAKEVMDRCLQQFPPEQLPYDMFSVTLVDTMLRLEEKEKAMALFEKLYTQYHQEINYYTGLSKNRQASLVTEIQKSMYVWQKLGQVASAYHLEKADEIQKKFGYYMKVFGMG